MSLRKHGRPVHGIVLLDKPEGMTSNRALQAVRRLFQARKAGHTGSLDPFATGMLPICLGEATKTAAFMLDADKAYRATLRLGQATETGDTEGQVVREMAVPALSELEIESVLRSFIGEIRQIPPMYSALKHQGQPLYKLAREGKTVERRPRTVQVRELRLLGRDATSLEFEVRCSKGTYIRTLAEDIGASMGSCAHLVALRRLFVQPFEADSMVSLEQLESDAVTGALAARLLPVDEGLRGWPRLELGPEDAERFMHGNAQIRVKADGRRVRVYGPQDKLLGLAVGDARGALKVLRVFLIGAS
jgi:tRNA pseudouridine55 synthase